MRSFAKISPFVLYPLLILFVITILFLWSPVRNYINDNETNFAIEDTSSIATIFMADKAGHSITLTHQGKGKWMVNQKYPANADNIMILLKTMLNLEVKSPVSKASEANVVKRMSAGAVKVEIYQYAYRLNFLNVFKIFPYVKKTKCFYVGDHTQDLLGTYMIKEGAEHPYIIHLPGFNGYLTTRFSPLEKDWRDRTVINISFTDLATVEVSYPATPEESYRMVKKNYDVRIFKANSNEYLKQIDTNNVFSFLSSFRNLNYEVLIEDTHVKDSILKQTPFAVINVSDIKGNIYQLSAYKRKGSGIESGLEQAISDFDPDRFYLLINQKELVVAQYFMFDRILVPVRFFE